MKDHEELEEIKHLLQSNVAEEKIMGILWCKRLPYTNGTTWEQLLQMSGESYQGLVPLIYSHPMAFNAYQKAYMELIQQLIPLFEKLENLVLLKEHYQQYLGKRALVNFEPNLVLWEKLKDQLS